MTLAEIQAIAAPFITFFGALIASGVASAAAVQALKFLKGNFGEFVGKFPRLVSVVISVAASVIAIFTSGINFIFNSPIDYIGFSIGTLILSAFTYKVLLKGTTDRDGQSIEQVKTK